MSTSDIWKQVIQQAKSKYFILYIFIYLFIFYLLILLYIFIYFYIFLYIFIYFYIVYLLLSPLIATSNLSLESPNGIQNAEAIVFTKNFAFIEKK